MTGRRWSVSQIKLVPPRLPGNLVHRAGLCTWLSHAVASSDVTLVCAPAGFGKTLLLAEWIATRSDAVWVSLDHDDDSAEHFLAALLSAIGEHAPPAPAQTDSSVPPGDIVTAVTELADAIEALPGRLVLVLDNLQEVPGRAALRVLATIIRHQPRNLRLVLSARSDPPLPLARLRVQGRLTELRADGLRFGQVEARELLARSGVTLTDGQLKRLVAQTDGWAAGIRLAARSLRLTGDPERLLSEYVSHDHTVADFLTGEVLSHLAADNRALLAMLSVCEQVSPRLAASLTGRDDVGDVLAGLERDGVLVTAVDGEQLWYQLHPMLRAYLRAELTRHQPELVTTLHHRAAAWFADHDSPREALRHAEQTGDERAAANLLHGLGVDMLLDGWPGLVLRGLTAAGTTVARDPWLLLFSGLAHLELGDLTTAESDIARSAQAWPSHEDERLAAFRRLVVSAHALACGRRPVPGDDGTCFSTTMEAWERLDHGLALLADRDYPGQAGNSRPPTGSATSRTCTTSQCTPRLRRLCWLPSPVSMPSWRSTASWHSLSPGRAPGNSRRGWPCATRCSASCGCCRRIRSVLSSAPRSWRVPTHPCCVSRPRSSRAWPGSTAGSGWPGCACYTRTGPTLPKRRCRDSSPRWRWSWNTSAR
ncbi:AAA family ATPase [Prauserella flavalba]